MAEAERIAARRMTPGQHRAQALGVDLAVEAEIERGGAEPALRLTLARVIVLGAFGDLFGVIALLARAELPDREHQRGCPPGGVGRSRGSAMPFLARAGGSCIGSGIGSPRGTMNCLSDPSPGGIGQIRVGRSNPRGGGVGRLATSAAPPNLQRVGGPSSKMWERKDLPALTSPKRSTASPVQPISSFGRDPDGRGTSTVTTSRPAFGFTSISRISGRMLAPFSQCPAITEI